jgi:hypothetical protein
MINKLLISAFLLSGIQGFAQLNKNRIMINGRGNFYTDKLQTDFNTNNVPLRNIDKVSEGNVNLNIGYFLSNNFAIGGIVGFGKNVNTHDNNYITADRNIQIITTQNFSTGVFARYNHMIKQSKFGLFIQLNNTYSIGKQEDENTHYSPYFSQNTTLTKGKNHAFKIGLTPGLMYFITNRLSIETSIGDLSYNSSVSRDIPLELQIDKQSQFNADFSMATVYFGLTFYLGGKKSEAAKTETSGN